MTQEQFNQLAHGKTQVTIESTMSTDKRQTRTYRLEENAWGETMFAYQDITRMLALIDNPLRDCKLTFG